MASVDRNGASLRRAELAQIHIAAKQLGIDRDTYEAMLHAVARVRSAGDLDWSGRKRVLEHLRHLGWAPGFNKTSPRIRKLLALWAELHNLGAVADRSARSLNVFCKRQTGVDRIEWLDRRPAELETLTESLKSWIARVKRGADARE